VALKKINKRARKLVSSSLFIFIPSLSKPSLMLEAGLGAGLGEAFLRLKQKRVALYFDTEFDLYLNRVRLNRARLSFL